MGSAVIVMPACAGMTEQTGLKSPHFHQIRPTHQICPNVLIFAFG